MGEMRNDFQYRWSYSTAIDFVGIGGGEGGGEGGGGVGGRGKREKDGNWGVGRDWGVGGI